MGLVALIGSFVLLFLLIFRASTWACLFCFTTYEERVSLCRMFVGSEQSKIQKCTDALTDAFKDLKDVKISEEPLLRKPGPWGGERESLSYSKKQREVQDHGRETGGNRFRVRW